MKSILLLAFFFTLTCSVTAQTYVETTFYAYKDSQFVNNNKRSLFDSEDKYDKKNRLIEKKYLGAVTKGSSIKFEYNDKDQRLTETHFDSTGKIRSTKKYSYNDSGKVKEVVVEWKDKGGAIKSSKEEYFYNEKMDLIHKTYSTSKNGLEGEWFFETKMVDGNKVIATRHLIKDKEQKPVEVIYNSKDLVTKEGTLTYTYEYDKDGEWITKRMYRKGEIVGEYRRVRRKK